MLNIKCLKAVSNIFLSPYVLASSVHELPFNIDVLSRPKGVQAEQYVVA